MGDRDRQETPGVGPPGSVGKELIAVAALVAALAGGGLWLSAALTGRGPDRSVSPTRVPPAGAFVGVRVCMDCHPSESAHHGRSGHARTLRPGGAGDVARRFDGRNAADPEFPGSTWSYVQKDGRLVADRSEAGRRNTYPLEFVLGSGQHALTPVSVVGRDDRGRPLALEHRLSYFAHLGHLDVTPGQRAATNASGRTPEGRYLSAEETRMCFDCHATRASRDRPDALDPATMTPNVSCERCHGPGRAHLEAALRGEAKLSLPFGHGAETAEAQVRLCGQCHRLPEQVPPDQLRPDNAVLARFQPVGLMRSRCYTRSRGGLSCSTCHDPHARTSRDRAGYESACLSCHDAAPKTVCPTSPRAGCLDCHMPRRDAGNGLRFTDHWIRVHPEAAEGHR